MEKVLQVYKIVKEGSIGFDAIYEDYVLELVGSEGLDILKSNRLVESCGVVYGRQLYVLCELKGEK
jgi:hypothetical protein